MQFFFNDEQKAGPDRYRPAPMYPDTQSPNENSFGASGSWAVALLACSALRCEAFTYPPGILGAALGRVIKEFRILHSIIIMEDINVKSVRYPEATDQKFEKIALKLGRTKRLVFMQMVDYFYKSKKDPLDLNDELLKNTLLKNHQQYIGFIKTQEQLLLVPMKTTMDRISDSQKQIVDRFNNDILEQNKNVYNNQIEIARLMEAILQSQQSKEFLKAQFIAILDRYIKDREAFNLITSSKEKEELVAGTKMQIKLL